MKHIWIFCILMATIPPFTFCGGNITERPDGRYHACGVMLTQLLQVTCRSRYNTPVMRRRSVSLPLEEALENSNTVLGMLLPKEKAISVLQFRRKRVKRGVYDECCRKPCSYDELRNYCAPEPDPVPLRQQYL